jgi:putative transposase
LERRFEDVDLLVIYLDGMMFGEHHVISAVGVDQAGHKHVLGIQPGATENAAAVEDLLQQLVARGVNPNPKRLFVIAGAKALRAAIAKVAACTACFASIAEPVSAYSLKSTNFKQRDRRCR